MDPVRDDHPLHISPRFSMALILFLRGLDAESLIPKPWGPKSVRLRDDVSGFWGLEFGFPQAFNYVRSRV